MLAFHTASFMTGAIALYDRLGFHRAPDFDFDMAAHFGGPGFAPIMSIAYFRRLTRVHAPGADVQRTRCPATSVHRKQRSHR